MEATLDFLTNGKADGRRHHQWHDEIKARIVSENLRLEVTVDEEAARRGLKPNHLSAWRTFVEARRV